MPKENDVLGLRCASIYDLGPQQNLYRFPSFIFYFNMSSDPLLSEIGRGVEGVVWKAHDRLLGKFVAVKVMILTETQHPYARREADMIKRIIGSTDLDTVYELGNFSLI
jgi:hypothetical protein